MSTKEWVYTGNGSVALYQNMSSDQENDNPAVIEIANTVDFKICYETNADGKVLGKLTADIPAEIFDAIAIAWCKKRSLHGALGGPVGKEWGSPNCDWD